MGAFSKFFLNFFMNLNVSFKSFYLSLHFIVLKQQLFSLLRLILQLSGQLMILEDGQPSRGLQLFIVECQEVSFGLLNFVQHVLSELLCGLDLFALFLIHIVLVIFLLSI